MLLLLVATGTVLSGHPGCSLGVPSGHAEFDAIELTSIASRATPQRCLGGPKGQGVLCTVVPPPGVSVISTSPSCDTTTSRTMASPRPAPPCARSRPVSGLAKLSKTHSRSVSGIPGPWSTTISAPGWRPTQRRARWNPKREHGPLHCRSGSRSLGETRLVTVHQTDPSASASISRPVLTRRPRRCPPRGRRHPAAPAGADLLIEAGKRQQIFNQPPGAVAGFVDTSHRPIERGPGFDPAFGVELGVTGDGCNRRPQLVGGIVGKAAEPLGLAQAVPVGDSRYGRACGRVPSPAFPARYLTGPGRPFS